jgi:hypothetical protein
VEECTYFWGVNTSWGINTAESKGLCIRKIIRLHNQHKAQQNSLLEFIGNEIFSEEESFTSQSVFFIKSLKSRL